MDIKELKMWDRFEFKSMVYSGTSEREQKILNGLAERGLTDIRLFRPNETEEPIIDFNESLFRNTFKNIPAIRAAYESGAGKALFIDGGVAFTVGQDELQNAMLEFPDDSDIVLLHRVYGPGDSFRPLAPYWEDYDSNIAETICYSLNRRVMRLYLEIADSGYIPDYDWIKELTGKYAANSLCEKRI